MGVRLVGAGGVLRDARLVMQAIDAWVGRRSAHGMDGPLSRDGQVGGVGEVLL